MDLIMLGTGAALAQNYYNTCFLLGGGEGYLLVDGGGGNEIIKRFKAAGVDFKKITDIFVTHKHIDHLLGIFWVIRLLCHAMKNGLCQHTVRLYAAKSLCEFIESAAFNLIQKNETAFIGKQFLFVPIKDGDTAEILARKVKFFDIRSSKAEQYGFVMEYSEGKKLVCCGDEPCSAYGAPHALNADWLLHEAFCLYSEAAVYKPYDKQHSTVKDACITAEKLGVKNLVLYHTEDKTYPRRKELYLAEGKQYFGGNLFVPEDLEKISVI